MRRRLTRAGNSELRVVTADLALGMGVAFSWDAPAVQVALLGLWAVGAMWLIRLVQRWRLQNRVDDVLASLARDEIDVEGC